MCIELLNPDSCFPIRIPDLVKNKYLASHPTALKAMEDKILSEKDVSTALQRHAGDTVSAVPPTGSSSSVANPASRTLATPDFDGQPRPNHDRRVNFDEKPLDDFNAAHTSLARIYSYLGFHPDIH